ncbi:MAG: hypothetical protein AAF649_06625 [Verrucomicrobiota bacterium]
MFGKKSKSGDDSEKSDAISEKSSETKIQDDSERPAPKPVPQMDFDPEFSPTCIIDLKKVVHSIHESKGGETPKKAKNLDVGSSPSQLLDAIVEEAHLLRQSGAEPEMITPILMSKLGYKPDTIFGKAANDISILAGELADQPTYHNPQHITEVILAAFSLGLREHLPNERMAELIIASAAHDLGHTGGINDHPYALETRSYEIGYPVMVKAGMTPEQIERIGQMILATDFMHGVPVVRENYTHLKEAGEPADSEAMMLAAQCLILTEADILFSCFSETYNELLSDLLSVEWKKGRALSFDERIGFLSSVQFISDAATQLGLDERRIEIIESLKKKSQEDTLPEEDAES